MLCILIVYLCLFLFFLFLWLPWWLPEEEEEAAFWGFRSCSVESTSSVSSWLGSFSWFWRSGEPSLSVPLPASPDGSQTTAQTQCQKLPKAITGETLPKLLGLRRSEKQLTFFIHVIRYPTECTYRLPFKTERTVALAVLFFLCSKLATNILCETVEWEKDLLQLTWLTTCWINVLLPWISYSFYPSYYWSSC